MLMATPARQIRKHLREKFMGGVCARGNQVMVNGLASKLHDAFIVAATTIAPVTKP
jgi:hypothetical protein